MKISRVVIKKFRSIESADIWIGPINAIVGQNNAGKSCLLRALNAFFNFEKEKDHFNNGVHSYTTRSVPKIEIHFENFDRTKFNARYISGDKIIVECSFNVNASNCTRTVKYKSGREFVSDDSILSEIKKHIEYILIPPDRSAHALEQVETSILKFLVEEKMKEATENRDNYTSKFKAAVNYLENHALRKIEQDIKGTFPVTKHLDVQIKYGREINYTDFLNEVRVSINELGQSHPLTECGSGIQSLTIISLYNLLGKARDENIIIGLEEPETNLHPQAQKELISYFQDLVATGNILQFFFTTHSSSIVDQVDHTDVIRFQKINDMARGFKTSVSRLSQDFYEKYNLDDFRYYQFHRYRNSDFFFSSYIIVTESKNEIEIIKRICSKAGIEHDVNGLSYLNLEGVDKAKYAIHLLKELDIPFHLIVDKDFFANYLNDEFDSSLDGKGFPIYKTQYANEDLLKVLVGNSEKREKILKHINTNHTKMLDLLEAYNITSMRYSLELDLVAIPSACEKYYELLRVPAGEQSTNKLTIKRKAIKKISVLAEVFDSLETRNWPMSYSRIKKIIVEINKKLK